MLADLLATPAHPALRCGARRDRPGYDRQIPADLRLDRKTESCHQHPADDLRQPGDAARDAGVPEGRAAGHRRLAAVESHLRRQSQYRADAVQWRVDVSRRRQADARRHRGDGAQPARGIADGLFQRPQGIRIAAALSARRQGAACQILPPVARDVLQRCCAVALYLEQPRRASGAGNRISRACPDRPRRHRNRAVFHVGDTRHQPLRPCRTSGVRQ